MLLQKLFNRNHYHDVQASCIDLNRHTTRILAALFHERFHATLVAAASASMKFRATRRECRIMDDLLSVPPKSTLSLFRNTADSVVTPLRHIHKSTPKTSLWFPQERSTMILMAHKPRAFSIACRAIEHSIDNHLSIF